jgi:helicase
MINIEDINEWDFDYEVLLGELKCALVLEAWINEMSEGKILESFNVQPGDLHRLVETGKWLIYTMYELSHLFGYKKYIPKILELQKRIQPGVTSELLPLVGLRGIGRVRGRMLYNAGYKTIGDLKRASLNDLVIVPTIGSRVARMVKEQVGGLVKMDEWERVKSIETEQKSLSDFNK